MSDIGFDKLIYELQNTYHCLPVIKQVPNFPLTNVTLISTSIHSFVRDIAEDPGTEVLVCKPDIWRDAAIRFPDLSVE